MTEPTISGMNQWLNTQAVEEFMQGYFAERADLRRSLFTAGDIFMREFFSANYLAAVPGHLDYWQYELDHPPYIESIRIKARRRLAIVTTIEPYFSELMQVRGRYYLLASEKGWLIDRKGNKCRYCDEKGYATSILAVALERNDGLDFCRMCNGAGWLCHQWDDN